MGGGTLPGTVPVDPESGCALPLTVAGHSRSAQLVLDLVELAHHDLRRGASKLPSLLAPALCVRDLGAIRACGPPPGNRPHLVFAGSSRPRCRAVNAAGPGARTLCGSHAPSAQRTGGLAGPRDMMAACGRGYAQLRGPRAEANPVAICRLAQRSPRGGGHRESHHRETRKND
jgi:hypothetical protein